MSEKTLTRMDLSEAVFREVGLSRNESAELVETILQHMSDALVNGEQVKISSFGTFSVREKKRTRGAQSKNRRRGTDPAASCFDLPSITFDERSRRFGKEILSER
jgi:integration host factor alpha subunit